MMKKMMIPIFKSIWSKREILFLLAFSFLPFVIPFLTSSPDMEAFYATNASGSFSSFLSIVLQSQFKLVLPSLVLSYLVYEVFREEFRSGILFLYKDLSRSAIFNIKLLSVILIYVLYTMLSVLTSFLSYCLFFNQTITWLSDSLLLQRELLDLLSTISLNVLTILAATWLSLRHNRALTVLVNSCLVLLSAIAPRLEYLSYLFPNGYVTKISDIGFGWTSFLALMVSILYGLFFYRGSRKNFSRMEF
ncbi:hypothetical protein [Streptococcus oralis]|uniref:ABC-type sugar transport system, permease component n=1 Tax=Streptococcus oralis TaxID=1303 RepID=A0A139PFK9_STROR|nr:hypothetical protein [Streptococcus oralis]KXT87978.1 ABC-type sugar transport system, permease component [Streptococcus oralis]